ncbi:MAG TPA: hypothetical protein PKI03_02555 [Pseudomonadota bacterium]|nr:hypothetical protein [Pseudomonadota bacterium]
MQTRVLCFSLAMIAALTTSAEGSPVSAAEQRLAYQAVLSLAKAGAQEPDMRRRLFYKLCSELPGCAGVCQAELEQAARPETDPSQRAILVASCAPDYRQRRDRGEALHPDAWLKERLVRFLDAVSSSLSQENRRNFEAARAQTRLLQR